MPIIVSVICLFATFAIGMGFGIVCTAATLGWWREPEERPPFKWEPLSAPSPERNEVEHGGLATHR